MTTKQTEMLIRFADDDYISDLGWEDPVASTWTNSICKNRSDAAVFGSLVTSGHISTNGDSCKLTDAGRRALGTLLASGQ